MCPGYLPLFDTQERKGSCADIQYLSREDDSERKVSVGTLEKQQSFDFKALIYMSTFALLTVLMSNNYIGYIAQFQI